MMNRTRETSRRLPMNCFWPVVLNDPWSKTICRPKMIVRSGATFILRWSCFDNFHLTAISLLRIIPSNRAENRLTEMTAAVSSELIFLKHTQCGHSMWPTKTDVLLKGQTKSKSKSECSLRECFKYMHKTRCQIWCTIELHTDPI